MKDPLHSEQTAYELLGLQREASQPEIFAALQRGLALRKNPQTLKKAWSELTRPLDRALLDLEHYSPEALARLTPNPLSDWSALQPSSRAATAAKWEDALRRSFPDFGVVHSLAVLWLWWAQAPDDETPRTHKRPRGFNEVDRWTCAIGYWTCLVSSEDFWNEHAHMQPDLVPEIRAALIKRFQNRLHAVVERTRERGRNDEECARLELALTTELGAAKAMVKAGIRLGQRKVGCGPLMLGRLGLVETMQREVATTLARTPASSALQDLHDALSPYSEALVLMRQNKPRDAIDALRRLPSTEKSAAEGVRLRARLYFELGRQQVGLERFDEALQSWRTALEGDLVDGTRQEMRDEIAAACLAGASALDPPSAIQLLEKALAIVSDDKLKLRHADLVIEQTILDINAAHEKAKTEGRHGTKAAVKGYEKAIGDLVRLAASGSARASREAEIARQVLEHIRDGGYELSAKAIELREGALAAANQQDWEETVTCIRAAIAECGGGKPPGLLRKDLVIALSSRAMASWNTAFGILNASHETVEQWWSPRPKRPVGLPDYSGNDWLLEPRMAFVQTVRLPGQCAKCSRSQFTDPGEWYSYPRPEGSALLCPVHHAEYQQLAATVSQSNPEVFRLLRSAERDLFEATDLQPADTVAVDLLKQVQGALSQLGQIPATRRTGRPAESDHAVVLSEWTNVLSGPQSPTRPTVPDEPEVLPTPSRIQDLNPPGEQHVTAAAGRETRTNCQRCGRAHSITLRSGVSEKTIICACGQTLKIARPRTTPEPAAPVRPPVPSSAPQAPARPAAPAARRRERSLWHEAAVAVFLMCAVVVTFDEVMRGPAAFFRLQQSGVIGMLVIGFAVVGLIPLVLLPFVFFDVGDLFQQLCGRPWRSKRWFLRLAEASLYAFAISLAIRVAVDMPRLESREEAVVSPVVTSEVAPPIAAQGPAPASSAVAGAVTQASPEGQKGTQTVNVTPVPPRAEPATSGDPDRSSPVYVVAPEAGLSLRTRPGKESDLVRRTIAGERYEVTGSAEGWYSVRLPDGVEAWILQSMVRKSP